MSTIHEGTGLSYGSCLVCGYAFDDENTNASIDPENESFEHCFRMLELYHVKAEHNPHF